MGALIQFPSKIHELYTTPDIANRPVDAEAVKAAFLRGEPFVDSEYRNRVSRYNFQAGDAIRIRYLRMVNVPVLCASTRAEYEVDLIFSITFKIPVEEASSAKTKEN